MTNDTLRQTLRGFGAGLRDGPPISADVVVDAPEGYAHGYRAGLLARDLAPFWLAFTLTAGVGYYFGWRDARRAR